MISLSPHSPSCSHLMPMQLLDCPSFCTDPHSHRVATCSLGAIFSVIRSAPPSHYPCGQSGTSGGQSWEQKLGTEACTHLHAHKPAYVAPTMRHSGPQSLTNNPTPEGCCGNEAAPLKRRWNNTEGPPDNEGRGGVKVEATPLYGRWRLHRKETGRCPMTTWPQVHSQNFNYQQVKAPLKSRDVQPF